VHTVLSGSLKQAVAWGWVSQNAARLATPPALRQSRFDRQPLRTPPHAAAGTQRGLAVAVAR
jgi:hypothetical protein